MGKSTMAACICTFSALGSFLFGLDMGYIGPILEDSNFKRDVAHLENWNDPDAEIPSFTSGFIVSVFALGCMFSAFPLVSGFFLDTLGRKVSLMLGSLVFLAGSVIQGISANVETMIIGRFVSGCSVGILSTVVPLYQSEMAPPQLRGSFTSLHQIMVIFGIVAASFANQVLLPLNAGWRLVTLLPTIPCLVLFIGMFFLPRSPRWLVQHGKPDEALCVLQSLRENEEADSEWHEIILDQQHAENSAKSRWADLCSCRIARLLAVGILLQLFQQLNGINAFVSFGPRIFLSLGLDANFFQTLMTAVFFVATLPAMYFIERFGRRSLLLSGAAGMFLSSTVVTTLGIIYTRQQEGKVEVLNRAAGHAMVASIFIFIASFAYSWGPTTWVYCAEIFPLKVRGCCVGLTTMFEWLGVFIVNQSTPMLLSSMGFGTFAIFGAFCLAAFLFALWLPETKGVSLERMDLIFDDRFNSDRQQASQKLEKSFPSQKLEGSQECESSSSQGSSLC
eukprot:TRINITY_DN31371_c0_g1_i1.p1 TRINITY_DN31371_c0_g1~~TRINITY_DN31371_c0_g1_i1.p1  ORF type:complete len:523 (+),score=63.32 TRINITY_DN31371_c0_g1_i1:54-1571(+)